MKRVYRSLYMLLPMILLSGLLVSGCSGIYEIKNQSFITAIGIDLTDDNKTVVSLVELLMEQSSGQSSEQSNQGGQPVNSRVITATCTFFPHCFDQFRSKVSGRLTLDKVQYVLLGKKLLESGVKPYFDYAYHVGQLEQTTRIFVTDQQITDFLKNDRGTIVSQLIGSIQFHSSVFNVEMWQFAPKLYTKHKSAVLSEIAIQNDELQANGIYLLKEDKLAMHLSADEGKLIHLLIKDKVRDLNIMLQKEQIAFRIRKYGVNLKVTPQSVELYVNLKGWVLSGYEEENHSDLSAIYDLEEEISKEIKNRLQKILDQTQAEGIDFMGIGEKFRQRNWDTSDWETQLKELSIHVHVDTKVLSGYGS